MKTTLTQQVVKNHYIEQLYKMGIKKLHGQSLTQCDTQDLRRTLAIQRAINH